MQLKKDLVHLFIRLRHTYSSGGIQNGVTTVNSNRRRCVVSGINPETDAPGTTLRLYRFTSCLHGSSKYDQFIQTFLFHHHDLHFSFRVSSYVRLRQSDSESVFNLIRSKFHQGVHFSLSPRKSSVPLKMKTTCSYLHWER